ncbi:hypothetical protein VTL71DRAFT_8689 [Oculimacula yallundae]|uniref:Uncharacterized protein n=1 Tax=Oculimacula yallundae TaxID=86028 RepID=A0ABR4CYC2_9HELO
MEMNQSSSFSRKPEEATVSSLSTGVGDDGKDSLMSDEGKHASLAALEGSQNRDLKPGDDVDHTLPVDGMESEVSTPKEAADRDGGVKDAMTAESGELALPVLTDREDAGSDVKGKKVIRTEIPDSEADTEEAFSPVKGVVVGMAANLNSDAQIAEKEDAPSSSAQGDENALLRDGSPDEAQTHGSLPMVNGENATHLGNDDLPTNPVHDDSSSALSKEQIPQHPENRSFSMNAAHLDSDEVSFVIDDDNLIVFPEITTSDLQPAHTQVPTQTQTQEEIVDSHFADAVAVMSDVGGGTQGLMSSFEAVVKGEDAVMEAPDRARGISQGFVRNENASQATEEDEGSATRDKSATPLSLDEAHSNTHLDAVEPSSSTDQSSARIADTIEGTVGNEEDVDTIEVPEEEDTEMTDDPPQLESIEAANDKLSLVTEYIAKDVDMNSNEPGHDENLVTNARSIPDSDEDEDIPDAEPVSKETTGIDKHDSSRSFPQSATIGGVVNGDNKSKAINSESASKSEIPKTEMSPKTPSTSFKGLLQTTTTENESQIKEVTSSPLKPEVATLPPRDATSKQETEKEKSSGRSFTASDGAQNKDVLMAELKAIKIASIQARNASLVAEIQKKRERLKEVTKELKYPAAETVKQHIKLLHDYNDIRDVGQGLVGMIADNRGVRIGELYEEFGVGLKD